VPFGHWGAGRETAFAAQRLISNESSCIDVPAPWLETAHTAGIRRSYSAQAEWLGDCAIAPNAQLFPIIIQCGHP
jgi:hypothetical protein